MKASKRRTECHRDLSDDYADAIDVRDQSTADDHCRNGTGAPRIKPPLSHNKGCDR
jgi:hypothetical protein